MTETPGGDGTPGGLDDRGRPGPCDGALLTAWNLYCQRYQWKDAVEELAKLGHAVGCSVGPHATGAEPIGRSTFYLWRDAGRDLALEGNELVLKNAQQRQLGTIDAGLAMISQRVRDRPDEIWLAMPHYWRGVREYAQLAGTDAPRRQSLTIEQPALPTPDPRQRAVVADAEATAAAELEARRAGTWPENGEPTP